MAGTTRLELATSAVTEVTVCNFTAPIATFGALKESWGNLIAPGLFFVLEVRFALKK